MLVHLRCFGVAFFFGVVTVLAGLGAMKVNEEYVPVAVEYLTSQARVFTEKQELLAQIETLEAKIATGVVAEFPLSK